MVDGSHINSINNQLLKPESLIFITLIGVLDRLNPDYNNSKYYYYSDNRSIFFSSMTTATLFANASDISTDDYCVFGLATCFIREDGEIHQVQIIEPIPSAALEAVLMGIPTSYQFACAKTLGEIFVGETRQKTSEFPPEAQFCDNFPERTLAATRTYKKRPEAQVHIPLGTLKKDFNYSLERKRLLNATNIVRTEDNVKQHEYTHKVL